ncbi:MAG: hypothetical protein JNM54_10990 [Candidatus Accumulibacter sp.]|uniref:hypothetical protein n=1 Tax=Accumulibacter sp. TaxID=2053492 RepID=UPI001A4A75B1|nr:hypothetical protein [Accumulibacter sp.]MBL8368425.1 hypothetical protein [Accumulibacter sp.]MBN8514854.1 hypothetical protein [Accumulibacter sp.]MBO3702419.1 hypothetical protein [Accumulibacter sp.]
MLCLFMVTNADAVLTIARLALQESGRAGRIEQPLAVPACRRRALPGGRYAC